MKSIKPLFKVFIIAFLTLGINYYLSAQTFNFYNNSGKLIKDTSFVININLLPQVREYEKNCFVKIQKELKYPELAVENGITGAVIVKLKIYKEQKSVESFLMRGCDKPIDIEVLSTIEKYKYDLLECTTTNDEFEFYIPFRFALIETPDEIIRNENTAITIKNIAHRLTIQ